MTATARAAPGSRSIALIGCGFIGGVHSMVLAGLYKAGLVASRVVVACDRELGRAQVLAAAHQGARATTDHEEAVDVADTVWICTPTSSHLTLAQACEGGASAIYCEKPLGRTLAEAEAVAAACSGATVQVGLVLRHSVMLRAMTETVTSGGLGPAMVLTLRDDQYFPVQGQYGSTWRGQVEVAGGGTLLEHSIHDLDLLTLLGGPVAEVSARIANFSGRPGVEDVAVVNLAHRSGATSVLTSVWHQVLSRASSRRFEVFCRDGVVWSEHEVAGPLLMDRGDGEVEVPLWWGDQPPERAVAAALELPEDVAPLLSAYVRADLGYLSALEKGTRAVPGLDAALSAHRLVDAAYRSAASGQPVTLAN
jgi:predicted dehydrogenase